MTANKTPDRDDVLFAFHEAYARPTARQIIEWTERYPQFADDIRAHAAVAYDWSAREGESQEEPNESDLANAFSRALSALYEGEVEADSKQVSAPTRTLWEMLADCGKDLVSLQQEISKSVGVGIERSVLADLFNGAMLGPLSNRLENAVRNGLALTVGEFQSSLARTLTSPRIGFANARAAPAVNPRSCEDIIRSSEMSDKQIRYWLGED